MKSDFGARRQRLLFRLLGFYVLSTSLALMALVWYVGLTHKRQLHQLEELTPVAIDQTVQSLRLRVAGAGALLIVISVGGGLVAWMPVGRRLRRIRASVEEYARGNFSTRMPSSDATEIGALADSLNWMAGQLEDRVSAEVRRRNEQEAVLSSMVEGVIAVDTDQRIINLNKAAARMVNLDLNAAQGMSILEVVRNPDLQRFINTTLGSRQTVEGDLVLHGPADRYIQANGAALTDIAGHRIGALIVLNDVTRLRRLESVRRDFVANVSHELKTPITSIKGFMETLLDGSTHSEEDTQRFLGIIAKQADRLDAIIEDLLSLSRIEQETERGEIVHKTASVLDMLNSARLACASKAEARNISVELSCPLQLIASMNAHLLEQAVINLLDNAIKYGPDGKPVRIEAKEQDKWIAISVIDQGAGIPRQHVNRIFERFYRIDKSRSRKLGGTGLGLSIVKHIVQAHSGKVTVDSVAGQGSTFTIQIPR